jgi:predicted DNA-binding protein (MmcQ/YjbR family)
MTLDDLRALVMAQPGAWEDTPFGPEALVYKVGPKMFALVAWQEMPLTISLKCHPQHALALRDYYRGVQPGYHLNKKHWITVEVDRDVPDDEVRALIEGSYELVKEGLTRAQRAELVAQTASAP